VLGDEVVVIFTMVVLTIARGNCRSIKRETAGKMRSGVRGLVEMRAAVRKELNATSTATIREISSGVDVSSKLRTWNTTPQCDID
jgi:hypothetical protein